MTHSVLGDLYCDAPGGLERYARRESVDRLSAEFGAMPVEQRIVLHHTDPTTHHLVCTILKLVVPGIVLAQIDPDPLSREAHAAAVAWLRHAGIDRRWLAAFAQNCLILGTAVVAVDLLHPRACYLIVPRDAGIEAGAGGRPRLVFRDGSPPFGDDAGERVYSVAFDGDVEAFRQRIVELIDEVVRDALSVLGLEERRPRVGVFEWRGASGQPSLTRILTIPAANGLPRIEAFEPTKGTVFRVSDPEDSGEHGNAALPPHYEVGTE